jgi:hypothetical protein
MNPEFTQTILEAASGQAGDVLELFLAIVDTSLSARPARASGQVHCEKVIPNGRYV